MVIGNSLRAEMRAAPQFVSRDGLKNGSYFVKSIAKTLPRTSIGDIDFFAKPGLRDSDICAKLRLASGRGTILRQAILGLRDPSSASSATLFGLPRPRSAGSESPFRPSDFSHFRGCYIAPALVAKRSPGANESLPIVSFAFHGLRNVLSEAVQLICFEIIQPRLSRYATVEGVFL